MEDPLPIIGIEHREHTNFTSQITILEGGIGHTYAKIKIVSEPGKSIRSSFGFFSRRPGNEVLVPQQNGSESVNVDGFFETNIDIEFN